MLAGSLAASAMPPDGHRLEGSTPPERALFTERAKKMPTRVCVGTDFNRFSVARVRASHPDAGAIAPAGSGHHPACGAIDIPRAVTQPMAAHPVITAMAPFPGAGHPHEAGARRGNDLVPQGRRSDVD